MAERNNVKIVFFEPILINKNSAAYNRFLGIVSMVSYNFNYKVVNPNVSNDIKNRIIRGLVLRLKIILKALHEFRNKENGEIIVFYLFGTDFILLLLFGFLKALIKIKVVGEINEYPISIIKNKRKQIVFNKIFIYPWLFSRIDGYSIISDQLISFFKGFVRRKIIVKIPMTVDFNRFSERTLNEHGNYIFYAGSLSQDKDGIIHLLNAFSKFTLIANEVNLIICGDGSKKDKELFMNTIKQLNIHDNVKYLGLINRNDIPGLVLNAMICVLPRPNSVQAQGGFPTKLGEYLASGKPVIVTDVGDIPKYLKNDEAFIISNKDIESELYDAFIEIKTDYNKALKIGMKGKERAKQEFSLDNNALKIEKFIHQVSGV
jgi:glycosyltransferase involved in cell wall biosynthesis